MLTRLFTLLACYFACLCSPFAQKVHHVNGTLVDEEKMPLIAATVVLLQVSDSSFANYGLTTDAGKFRLDAKRDQDYILQVTYMGYDPFVKKITLDKDYDLGEIIMKEATNLLESVQVEADHIPIQMRGDTLEFNSAAFNVQAHDDVAKLLEQMPGVEIDEAGNVKINGKKVEKILVDGKEFFGEDIQVALNTLPADAIDKIEVYDKKTDKEELTGSESKDKNKTVNLTLKEDKKIGFMGNIDGGYGYPNHRYKGSLNLHFFNPKMRISALGAINNINQSGFSYRDYQGMTGGNDNFMRSNSAMSISQTWNDPILGLLWGQGNGETRAIACGLNMNFFPTDKTEFSVNYMYTNANKSVTNRSFIRNITAENFYTRNSETMNLLMAQRHIINTSLTHKFDTTQELRFRLKMKVTNSDDEDDVDRRTLGTNDTLANTIDQLTQDDESGLGLITNVYYQKKFKKKGRSFSGNIAFAYVDNQKLWNTFSQTSLYSSDTITRIDTLNQEQNSTNGKQVYGAEVSYTEPINDENWFDFSLMGGFSNEQNNRTAFDWIEQLKVPNTALTDLYQKHYNFQEFRTTFEREVDAYSFSVSAGLKRSELRGVLASNSTQIAQDYYYPVGGIDFEYNISENKSFGIYYSTEVNEPRLDQLQPMVNNQNPLSLRLGNPNLIPEYSHDIWLTYNLWDQLTFTSCYISVYADFVQNGIIDAQRIDENFRTIYEPINVDFKFSGGAYAGYNTEIKKVIKLNIRGGVNIGQSPVVINNVASNRLSNSYNAHIGLSNKKKKIVDASISADVRVTNSIFSSNESLNVVSINHSYRARLRVTIAKKWNIKTDFLYSIFDDLGYGEALDVPVWSARVNRTFLKGDQLKIEFSVENILNEAYRVNRSNWNGTIAENQTNLLGRYFMLAVSYKINKMGGAKPPSSGGDVIIYEY